VPRDRSLLIAVAGGIENRVRNALYIRNLNRQEADLQKDSSHRYFRSENGCYIDRTLYGCYAAGYSALGAKFV
jgi:hypothetical protein